MDAKFRSQNKDSVKRIATVAVASSKLDAYDALKALSLSAQEYDSNHKSAAQNHVRLVAQLPMPVLNEVLAQANGELLRKLLKVPKSLWEAVIHFEKLLQKDGDEYVTTTEALDGVEYYIGTELIEHMIDVFDVNEALFESLCDGLIPLTTEKFKGCIKDVYVLAKCELPGSFELVDGWWAQPKAEKGNVLVRGLNLEDAHAKYVDLFFATPFNRYSLLRNMLPDKQGLYGMLNYNLIIPPYGMRPKIDNREHKLTKRYAAVLKASYELEACMRLNPPVAELIAKYKMLSSAVRKVQYKIEGKNVKPDDLSVLQRMKTKRGQIRMSNLGKRQDYSGRGVVVINPFLSLDVIRIPAYILPKLVQFHVLPTLAARIRENKASKKDPGLQKKYWTAYDKIKLTRLSSPAAVKEILAIINELHLLDELVGVMGRQPTLHKQSIQGFFFEISEMNAIEVNPLVCPGYNMDFDGDQAWLHIPMRTKSLEEAKRLILTTQNLFLEKTGECTTEPRQDMLYGLYMCTRNSYTLGESKMTAKNCEDVRQIVFSNKLKVYDTVYVLGEGKMTAGDACLRACFMKNELNLRGVPMTNGKMSVVQVDKKTISKYIDYLLRKTPSGRSVREIGEKSTAGVDTFVGSLNRLVETGFKVARLYPPNMSLLTAKVQDSEFVNAIDMFYDDMALEDELYSLGFETDTKYKAEFDSHLDTLRKRRSPDKLIEALGSENGYVKLSVSGARGSKDNLTQAFSYKGRIKKDSNDSFDALIPNSYSSQLTPFQAFIASYGGLQGQIDKSLKTGDTGYAMRLMWHATQGLQIKSQDCGTNKGLVFTKASLLRYCDVEASKEDNEKEVSEIFKHIVEGRFIIGYDELVSADFAKELAEDDNVQSVTVRSPLTCTDPCCAKCYGINWGTRKLVVPGTPVAVIAAQSIGEPGSQLTLKEFQKGGVANGGAMGVTSAFDKVNNYVRHLDLAKRSREGKYSGYDPLAWATGKVVISPSTELGINKVKIEGSSGRGIKVPASVVLKSEAKLGEGLSATHGDLDLFELERYAGIEEAQKYLLLKLFTLYKSELLIKTVHFEILVAALTRYMVVKTDRTDILVGQYCTYSELMAGSTDNTEVVPRLLSVKALPNASVTSGIDAIIMESQSLGLSRLCLLGLSDNMQKPLSRMLFAQAPLDGSALPSYLKDRYL